MTSLSQPAHARSLPRIFLVFCLLFAAAGCGAGAVVRDSFDYVTQYFDKSESSLRKRLVVVPFHSGIAGLDVRAKALSQIITQQLGGQGNLVLVSLEPLQKEMDKIGSGIRDPQERMLEAARRLGYNTILTGRITDLSVSYRFKGIYGFRDNTPFLGLEADLSLYDATSGTLVAQWSPKKEIELDDTESEGIKLGKAPPVKKVDNLAAQMVKPVLEWVVEKVSKQPWSGVVLAVEGDKIKVPVGRDTGLPLESLLTVYARGQKITTGGGRPIYLPGRPVGRIVLKEMGPRASWAVALPREEKEEKKEEEKKGEEGKGEKKDNKEAKPQPLKFEVGQVVRPR
jgi:hypothetical protein